jgi:CheY-like chemotaxis protein
MVIELIPVRGWAVSNDMRLLIVDDEPAVLRCLERSLSRRGYEVTTVERADAALILMKKRFFDAILTDVDMPGMKGDELARSLPPHVASRVVLMSGRCYDEDERQILAKPISLAALINRLESAAAA